MVAFTLFFTKTHFPPPNKKCLRNSENYLLFNANIGEKTVNAMILFKYPNQLLPWYKTVPLKT